MKSNNKSRLFESLDFLYVPAPDIEASISYYTNVLGSELLWKIHAFGVWVACVRVSNSEPLLLLADHIKKNDLIMIYRVSSLDSYCIHTSFTGLERGKNVRDFPRSLLYLP